MDTIAARGIEVVGIEWAGQDLGPRREDGIALRQTTGVVAAAATRNLKVVLLYDLAIRQNNNLTRVDASLPDFQAATLTDFNYFKQNYFTKANYFRINGKPVVYVYISRAIRGSPEAVGALFDQVRSQVGDFYFVADVLFWGGVDFEKVRRMKPDAVTAFHAFDGIQSKAVTAASTQKMRTLADATASQIYDVQREGFLEGAGAPVIHPGVSPQYDDASNASPCAEKRELSPVGTQTYALTSLEDWDHVLRRLASGQKWAPTRVRVRRNCSEQVSPRRLIRPWCGFTASTNGPRVAASSPCNCARRSTHLDWERSPSIATELVGLHSGCGDTRRSAWPKSVRHS